LYLFIHIYFYVHYLAANLIIPVREYIIYCKSNHICLHGSVSVHGVLLFLIFHSLWYVLVIYRSLSSNTHLLTTS